MKSNYLIVREQGFVVPGTTTYKRGDYRILNVTTNTLLSDRPETLGKAKKRVQELDKWTKGNRSEKGKARTKVGNDKYIKSLAKA